MFIARDGHAFSPPHEATSRTTHVIGVLLPLTALPDKELKRSLPLVLAVALFMEQIDSTVISTSLPAIAADIGTSPIALKLALTAYLVSLAIFIPISGWMASRFGAKNIFRAAIGVFIVGSLLSAASWSLESFVVSRFVQGMGGAMMTPIARLILLRGTPRNLLVGAMAWLSIPALVGPMLGPPLGGFLTTYATWHWIFLVNVPIGLAGIWAAGRILPDIPRELTLPLDWIGFLLAGFSAAGIVFGLSVVSLPALPPVVGVITTLLGIVCGMAYVRHSRRAPAPLLNLDLFRKRIFRTAIIGATFFRIGAGAVPFLLPLMFQLVFGLTPFQSGLLTFVSAIGAFGMKFLATTALRFGGFRTVVISAAIGGGLLVGANGLFTVDTPYPVIMAVLITGGFLRSLFFTSTNALVFAEIDNKDAAQATALAAVMQQMSIALGVAFGGGILEVTSMVTGGSLDKTAFMVAFFGVAAISLCAVIPFMTLPRDAGSDMSGHRLRGKPAPQDQQIEGG